MDSNALNLLPEDQVKYLRRGGFYDAADILCRSPQELSRKCKISFRQAEFILEALFSCSEPPSFRTLEEARHDGSEVCTTGDVFIDEALGGGVRTSTVWELVGESSAGKSQFALTLSLTVQLPREMRGLHGSSCYLTTSSTIPTTRLVQLTQLHPVLAGSTECSLKDVHTISVPTLPIITHVLSDLLPAFIEKQAESLGKKPVKLLVIDALTELFHDRTRTTTGTLVDRAKNIALVAHHLHTLAGKHQLVVLVLNEVVDVFNHGNDDAVNLPSVDTLYADQVRWFGRGHSIPEEKRKEASLGLVWANQVNVRIMLSRTGRRRHLGDFTYQQTSAKRLKSSTTNEVSDHAILKSDEEDAGECVCLRRLSVIFSSVAPPTSLDYIITEAGISSFPEVMTDIERREK